MVVDAPRSTVPPPTSGSAALLETATRLAVIGIFLILLGVALDLARTLLLPFVSAAVLALVLGPLEATTKEWGVPPWLFALIVLVLVIAALNAAIIPASVFVIGWITHAPDTLAPMLAKLRPLIAPLDAIRGAPNGEGVAGGMLNAADLAKSALAFLTPTVGEMIIFLAALFFLLTSRKELRSRLTLYHDDQENRLRTLRILNEIESDLKRYVTTVTIINLVFGLIIAVTAQLIGLPKAPLWGVLAFALKFLPYIGPALIFAILLGGGLATFDSLAYAFIAPSIFIFLDTAETYFVTPSIIGKRLTLSPGLVFVAVAFWAWMWGPIGAFLATPLLIAGVVTINHAFPKHEIDLPS